MSRRRGWTVDGLRLTAYGVRSTVCAEDRVDAARAAGIHHGVAGVFRFAAAYRPVNSLDPVKRTTTRSPDLVRA